MWPVPASGKGGGFLAASWCDGTPLGILARRSFALHAQLAETLEGDWGLPGQLTAALMRAAEAAGATLRPSGDEERRMWIELPAAARTTLASGRAGARLGDPPHQFDREALADGEVPSGLSPETTALHEVGNALTQIQRIGSDIVASHEGITMNVIGPASPRLSGSGSGPCKADLFGVLRGWLVWREQVMEVAPVHEVGAHQAGEGEWALDGVLRGLGEAQRKNSSIAQRRL